MQEVYVLAALRTPIVGRKGRFKAIRPEVLGAEVIKALLRRCELTAVDGILGGNAVGTGGNITRLMALLAGLCEEVPACTVDMQCASAAAAIGMAYAKIASGQGDIWLAGGMESSSLQPLRTYAPLDDRYALVPTGDGRYYTAQFAPEDMAPDTMLRGAERVAAEEGITRAELEKWALYSHTRAAAARRDGVLQDVIVPIQGWSRDDGIRPHMSKRLLDRLPLLLGEGTTLTAGTACSTNDGAAFAVLASKNYLERQGKRPLARIVGTASVGGSPAQSPRGAMRTADVLLTRLGWRYEDLQAIEFNEAFAVIDVLFERKHPACVAKYNSLGGALAYGHPYGASGGILLAHLIKSLQRAGGGRGILSIAGAGGMGEAIALELVE
ncbi:MAG: acetyl-CoA C-acyltransferase [Selenomonas sp.]|uniref:thiolase family protein n=1 Tax=Selenomonas sp. TaxID=2053611 RepID=UPI0025D621B7|nr:acetyl-CoA C-acyltransferase [Selenomonas sp.]MCR5439310.1 acetyl-CoA C-acyltransferase [Selenomonas sp.]